MKKILSFILIIGLVNLVFGQTNSKDDYTENWNFYITNIDGKLGSIATDLNLITAAPIENQTNLFYISIQMEKPKENGLSSNKEAERLWDIEDAIIEHFDKSNLDYTFAGRITFNGLRELFFYGEDTTLMNELVIKEMTHFKEYEYVNTFTSDKEWTNYITFLYPIPEQLESIQNRSVVAQLESHGDNLTSEREVFHWIYFNSQKELKQFEKFAISEGFKTLEKRKVEDIKDFVYLLQISRTDKIGYKDIDEYCLLLWKKAIEFNGEYDGWETSVEK